MKLEIRHSTNSDKTKLKSIFLSCFSDDCDYIDFFFENCYDSSECIVGVVDEEIVSMLFLIKVVLTHNNHKYNGVYLYAIATLPQFRGKGIMHNLEEYAINYAKSNGTEFACLVPQTQSLVNLYKKLSYNVSSYLYEEEIPIIQKDECVNMRQAQESEFIQFRKNYLQRIDNAVTFLDDTIQRYQYKEQIKSGGNIIIVDDLYYICGYVIDNTFIIRETSMEKQRLMEISYELTKVFPITKILIRANDNGNQIIFGMLKSLTSIELKPIIYMNLMLD